MRRHWQSRCHSLANTRRVAASAGRRVPSSSSREGGNAKRCRRFRSGMTGSCRGQSSVAHEHSVCERRQGRSVARCAILTQRCDRPPGRGKPIRDLPTRAPCRRTSAPPIPGPSRAPRATLSTVPPGRGGPVHDPLLRSLRCNGPCVQSRRVPPRWLGAGRTPQRNALTRCVQPKPTCTYCPLKLPHTAELRAARRSSSRGTWNINPLRDCDREDGIH